MPPGPNLMTFAPGDRVHLPGLGTGIVRAARHGGRYEVEIKGRSVIVAGSELQPAVVERESRKRTLTALSPRPGERIASQALPSLDLHGKSVAESVQALEVFVNDALLAGHHEARVIHGRSGGRVKAAVHRYLRGIASISGVRLDPQNAGVTIVTFS